MFNQNAIKKEILRMTNSENWVVNNIKKMVQQGMDMQDKRTFKSISQLAYAVIDTYY